jgi:hypothetical protein
MIEMDDAGSGSPILGEVFVARRVETGEVFRAYTQHDAPRKKSALEEMVNLLDLIKPTPGETFYLCRGEIFNGFAAHLKKAGYPVERIEMIGETNDLAEETFREWLRSIGVPESIIFNDRDFAKQRKSLVAWYRIFYRGPEIHKDNLVYEYDLRNYIIYNIFEYPLLMEKILYDRGDLLC